MKNSLIICKISKLKKANKENFYLINHSVLEQFSEEEINHFNFKMQDPIGIKSQERIENYKICENIFKSLFENFYKEMNKFHNINLNERAWKIITESWLKRFIYICFFRHKSLQQAINNFNIKKIYLKKNDKFLFFSKDCEGQYSLSADDLWNSNLYYKLLKYFDYKLDIEIENNELKNINHSSYSERILSTKKNLKVRIAEKILKINRFFVKDDDCLIFNSYLPFLYEKYFEIKCNQLPQFWSLNNYNFKNFDSEKRNLISFKKGSEKNLENFIRKILPNSLPISFVESFKDIIKSTGHYDFPKNPKFIYISTGFDHDEKLKFYIAKNVTENTKYFVGQHGASYFTDHDANFRTEVNTADKFFSWGFSNPKKNIYPAFNFKTFKRNISNNNKGKFLIVCRSLGYNSAPWDRYYEGLQGIKKTSEIFSLLPPKIKEKSIIRLHHSFRLNRSKYFLNKFFNESKNYLEFGRVDYKELIKDSRIICFNYDSTGFLENLTLNIPSIVILANGLNHIKKEFKIKYQNLINAKIIFDDEKNFINHLNNIWDDVHKWWFSEEIQTQINNFNHNLNIKGSKKEFENFIEQIKKD